MTNFKKIKTLAEYMVDYLYDDNEYDAAVMALSIASLVQTTAFRYIDEEILQNADKTELLQLDRQYRKWGVIPDREDLADSILSLAAYRMFNKGESGKSVVKTIEVRVASYMSAVINDINSTYDRGKPRIKAQL